MSFDGVQFHLVETWEEAGAFIEWLCESRDVLAVDTETGGLEWWDKDLRLVQFGDDMSGWAIPWDRWPGLVHEAFARHTGDFVMHNAKFDIHFLENNGVDVPRHRVHDTMLLAYLHDNTTSNALKRMTSRMLGVSSTAGEMALKDTMRKAKWTWETVPVQLPVYWQYACLDTVLTSRLFHHPEIYSLTTDNVYDLELGVMSLALDMETRGCRIDTEYVTAKKAELETVVDAAFEEAHLLHGPGINLFSNQQMIELLLRSGATLTKRTDKGQLALDEEVLLGLSSHPVAELVLRARSAKKIISTYFNKLTDTRARPSINQVGAAKTGRMSVTTPPLQTLPRGRVVRDAFIPSEEHSLVMADYDQIELRLMAHFAGEEEMIKAIWDGIDLHTRTAQLVYRDDSLEKDDPRRQVAKNSNFAKIYGAGIATFAATAGISIAEAERFLAGYDAAFPGVRRFQMEVDRTARSRAVDGATWVTTPIGRKQRCDLDSTYKLTNYLIQGTAADVLKQKMLELDAAGVGEFMILPVHDEIVFDVPNDVLDDVVRVIEDIMPDTTQFSVPLSVEASVTDDRWGVKYA